MFVDILQLGASRLRCATVQQPHELAVLSFLRPSGTLIFLLLERASVRADLFQSRCSVRVLPLQF